MAESIAKREIARLPVRSYDAVRDGLRSGDLVFCSGSYLFSGLIRRFTRSVWSHVGIVYCDDHLQRLFVLESETGVGVRPVPISKYLRDYHGRRRPYRGQIVIGRVEPAPGDEHTRRAVSFGTDVLTKPYDNFEILPSPHRPRARHATAAGGADYRTSLAKSASRERSPRASVRCPLCGQPLKRSTA